MVIDHAPARKWEPGTDHQQLSSSNLMSTSPARAAAFDVLLRVEQNNSYASELLHSSQFSKLSPADHALTTELVMGVLRWRSLLDAEIIRFSNKGVEKLDLEVLTALRLAAYQLLFLDRIPGRAAVHESVELVKRARKGSAAPFANAVLRKLASATADSVNKPGDPEEMVSAAALSQKLAHPLWMVERWVQRFGLDRTQQICTYDQHAPLAAVRLTDSDTESELKSEGIDLAPGQLISSARRIHAGNVSLTRAFGESRVAIQDEASQLVGLLVGKGSNILDCCAAPGGKTRVLAEKNLKSGIVALELHEHRARLLRKLVSAGNVEVINSDVLTFKSGAKFDRVLADVPCSGTGTLVHNPEIKWRLKPEDLVDLHGRQLAILRAAMQQVVSGGRLVYSTCSLEPEENEEVVEQALAGEITFSIVDCRVELEKLRAEGELAWSDLDSLISGRFVRTIPGVHPCDGFFVAILEKD
jgi:16S rRNA (cytosine967-C5)-methyltransferase